VGVQVPPSTHSSGGVSAGHSVAVGVDNRLGEAFVSNLSADVLVQFRLIVDSVVPVPGRHFWASSGWWATPVPVPA
jgi:hypothetical protein